MEQLNKNLVQLKQHPIRVMQFGEGNFLRAFVDYMIDIANEKGVTDMGVAIVKAIEFGNLDNFKKQDNLYTVLMRGVMNGEVVNSSRVVTSVQKAVGAYENYEEYAAISKLDTLRFIISNTTEAGIVYDDQDKFELCPPITYPGKLTKLLYSRFEQFKGAADKGLIIIPCELIEHNGDNLKKCVNQYIDLWNLGDEFKTWVANSCVFCNTLVDRIVTGYPRDIVDEIYQQLGYIDHLVDTCEPFGLWVIESEKDISADFPLDKAGLPVIFTEDQTPYRERKVRILNGAHTSTVLGAYLAGKEIVLECMKDPDIRKLMESIVFEEIAPTVKLPAQEVKAFADSVLERFENPFIKHRLLDISLNSISKWKARILPTFRDCYKANGKIPRLLTFSFAALLAFYTSDELRDGVLIGHRDGQEYNIKDGAEVLEFFAKNSKSLPVQDYVAAVASNEKFWGEDLTRYEGFVDTVSGYLAQAAQKGMKQLIHEVVEG